jgi:hypothetical protein
MSSQIPILLEIFVSSVDTFANWVSDSSAWAGYPYQWTVVMTVLPQQTSIPDTTTPYYYTGTDITVGMWMSNAVGGLAWIIRSITSQDTSNITCVVEDVAQYDTYADPTQSGTGLPSSSISGFIFALDAAGQPILGPVIPDIISPQWQTDIMARFAVTHPRAFVFTQATPSLLWTIDHNMGSFPDVEVVDTSGEVVEGDIKFVSDSQLTISFAIAAAGKAYLN